MKNAFAHLSLALAMTLAGSSVVVGKVLIAQFPVFFSQVISLVFAIAAILPFAFALEGNVFKQKITRRDLLLMFLQATTGMFLFRVFILFGLKFTSAASGGIITSATPAILCLLSFLFLHERMDRRTVLGVLLCFVGVLATNSSSFVSLNALSLRTLGGNALVLLAVVCEALFTIFRKKASFSHKPITSTLFVLVFSLLLFLPVSLFELGSSAVFPFTLMDYFPLFFYGVFCSALAYVLWFVGIAKVPVSIAASYTCMMPISALVLSYFFLGELLSVYHLIGIVLCLGGIFVISIYKPHKKRVEALIS